MEKILHKISHWLGWNHGTVESWHMGSELWTGFKCSTCHEINHAHCTDFIFSYRY